MPLTAADERDPRPGVGRTPVTIVTGFLGAGKTSLLRHLATHAAGRRLAFVVNEFGELGIDRELLLGCGIAGCGEADIVELANGCICCTVADDFLPTMRRLLDRLVPPEHIVIETSGLALPKPLVKAMGWPDVRSRATVDGVLAVVDAEAVAAGTFATDPAALAAQQAADPALTHESPLEEVFLEQALCADLLILNKADRIGAGGRDQIEAFVRDRARPGAGIVWTDHGRLDPGVALGLGMAAEADLAARRSPHEAEGDTHDHDDFTSFALPLPPVADPARLAERIAEAARQLGLLRTKGFAAVSGRPSRRGVQAACDRVSTWFDRPWRESEPRAGRLVVIGLRGLAPEAVRHALAA